MCAGNMLRFFVATQSDVHYVSNKNLRDVKGGGIGISKVIMSDMKKKEVENAVLETLSLFYSLALSVPT